MEVQHHRILIWNKVFLQQNKIRKKDIEYPAENIF